MASNTEIEQRKNIGAVEISARIRRQIVAGQYSYNDSLPSERELAGHFGSARGTIREALLQLEKEGLVERKIGSGTYIRHQAKEDETDSVAEMTSPMDLIEVRIAVEPTIARLAVLNANARNIRQLEETLLQAESTNQDPEIFSAGDEAFHMALAECTQNPLMIWIYREINKVREHTLWKNRKDKILTPKRIDTYNAQHRKILKAITTRDSNLARDCINEHLQKARSDLLGPDLM